MQCHDNAQGIEPLIVVTAFVIGVMMGAGIPFFLWVRAGCRRRSRDATVVPDV